MGNRAASPLVSTAVTNNTGIAPTPDTHGEVPGKPSLDAEAGEEVVILDYLTLDDGGRRITDHEYRQSTDGGTTWGRWTVIESSGVGEANAGGYTVRELPGGTEYTFEVRARNAHGYGVPSDPATAKPPETETEPDPGTETETAPARPSPNAWLGRFGRTLSQQVLDAVAERLSASRAPGFRGRVGGRELVFGGLRSGEDRAGAAGEAARFEALGGWLEGDDAGGAGRDEPRPGGPTARALLAGSAFLLSRGSPELGGLAMWGRGALSRFDGRDGRLGVDGEVRTALIGADVAREGWTGGVVASLTRGEGDYHGDGDGAALSSALIALHPFAGIEVSERLSVWAAAGAGEGRLKLGSPGEARIGTDLSYRMAAAGAVSELRGPGGTNGARLTLRSDARLTRTLSEAVAGDGPSHGELPPGEAQTWRGRLGVEGSWRFTVEDAGAVVVPSLDLGVRRDGGDAETGFGADLGGGLALRLPVTGFTMDLAARGMLAHEASGFGERGASAAVGYDPDPSSPLGLRVAVRQGWGAASTGGAHALLARPTLAGLGDQRAAFASARRLEASVGYAMPVFGGRFTGTPELGLALSEGARDWRLGWQLGRLARGADGAVDLGVAATRREAAGAPVHGLSLGGSLHW